VTHAEAYAAGRVMTTAQAIECAIADIGELIREQN
jgi:hypothetical protein